MLHLNILDNTKQYNYDLNKYDYRSHQFTRYVLSRCRCTTRGLWSGHDVDVDLSLKPTTNLTVCSATGLRWKMSRGDELEQSRERFQKPYLPSPGAGSRRREVLETCSLD